MATPFIRPDEMAKLNEFRASDKFAAMSDEFQDSIVMQDANRDDHLIVRFLRARNHDVPAALKMFKDMLQWRRDFGTDQALTWNFPQIDRVKECYPHGFHKFAKSGLPVFIGRVGRLRADELLQLYNVADLVRLHVQIREYFRTVLSTRASKRSDGLIDQQIFIFDVNGVSLSTFSTKMYKLIKETSHIDQHYYPEVLSNLFIVNAPPFFSMIWRVIKSWVEETIQKKMVISRSSNEAALLELIDSASLPDFLGGTDTSFLNTQEETDLRHIATGETTTRPPLLSDAGHTPWFASNPYPSYIL